MALKHQWILDRACDHFDTCREKPCHAFIAWELSSCGTTYADLGMCVLDDLTAADIRAAMAWYRSTGWLLEPADKHFICGFRDETASGYIARKRDGNGWSWQRLADDMHGGSGRSAAALRAAVKRYDAELREAESNA